ncbi:MAG: hypothetical protein WCB76_17990, partial [Acidobacteriaceae bacterium]
MDNLFLHDEWGEGIHEEHLKPNKVREKCGEPRESQPGTAALQQLFANPLASNFPFRVRASEDP